MARDALASLEPLTPLDAPPRPAGPHRLLFGDDAGLLRVTLIVAVAATAWKLAMAATGNVIWDEAHFAVLGRHLDWGYTDVPAGWPLLGRLGTLLFGWSPLALRLGGLAVAQAIPPGVYFLARPLVSRREAIWAALLSMLIPAFGGSGVIFYPEGALQLLMALMLGAIARALRQERLIWWAAAGVFGALGLFTHFRFVMAGVGVAAFLVASPGGRSRLTRPGPYVAALIAALGLMPAVAYNMREHWPSLAYHLVNRQKQTENLGLTLLLIGEQALMLTPVAFVGLLVSARTALRDAFAGSESAALISAGGLTILLFYLLISPFTRDLNAYWLFLGYVPFLPGLPAALISFVDAAANRAGRSWRTALIWTIPLLASATALVGTAFVLGWRDPSALPVQMRPYLFSRLEDWRQMEPALDRARADAHRRLGPAEPVIVASGHIPALRMEFPGQPGRNVYSLDEPYDEVTRFSLLRRAWELDEAALRRAHPNAAAILVLPEPNYLYTTPAEVAFRRRVCAEVDDLHRTDVVEMPPGRTAVEVYTGRVRSAPKVAPVAPPCPLFPVLQLARPLRAELLRPSGPALQSGVAADASGIRSVDVMLDGRLAAHARYGLDTPGARAPDVLAFDPGYPRVQFDFQFPRTMLTPGAHRVWLRATRRDGHMIEGGGRTFYVP